VGRLREERVGFVEVWAEAKTTSRTMMPPSP